MFLLGICSEFCGRSTVLGSLANMGLFRAAWMLGSCEMHVLLNPP